MNVISRFFERLFYGMMPPEEPHRLQDPEYMQRYQHAVAKWRKGIVKFNWLVISDLAVINVVVFGLLIPANWNRVAWSDDIDTHVRTELHPVAARTSSNEAEIANLKRLLAEMKTTTDLLLLSQMRVEIRETRRQQCHAIRDNDPQRKSIYGRMLSDLIDQYEEMRKRPWVRIDCEELI
jgi:hypothetical protein